MNVPDGTTAKIEMTAGAKTVRILLVPPDTTELQSGSLTGVFQFGAELHWPDRTGERVVELMLSEGEPVVFQFANLGDALACRRELQRRGLA